MQVGHQVFGIWLLGPFNTFLNEWGFRNVVDFKAITKNHYVDIIFSQEVLLISLFFWLN